MPSESDANETAPPINSTTPEEEDMLTSFFNGIFGSDNTTQTEQPEEEQDGITEFFTNLFGGEPENATVSTTNKT